MGNVQGWEKQARGGEVCGILASYTSPSVSLAGTWSRRQGRLREQAEKHLRSHFDLCTVPSAGCTINACCRPGVVPLPRSGSQEPDATSGLAEAGFVPKSMAV